MNLSELQPGEGATHRRKRIGRGIGSGTGKTCGKGTKGDKARGQVRPGFEGGKTPLHRRLPHFRGFTQPFKKEYAILNLSDLEKFEDGSEINPDTLQEKRVIADLKDGVKILGGGELTKKKLVVSVHQISKSAEEKIVALGGTVEKISRGSKN